MATTTQTKTRELSELTALIGSATGFPAVVAALERNLPATIDGAWGSSCALAAAPLARQAPSVLLVVLAHISEVDDFADDLAAFAAGPATVFPAWESLPREHAPTDETFARRLRALRTLARAGRTGDEAALTVVTTIQALLQPVPTPDELLRHQQCLRVGDTLDIDALLGQLLNAGLTRSSAVELPGEFAMHGGILDIFPFEALHPLRVELFGDSVESLRHFDVESQRSLEQVREVTLTLMAGSASETGVGSGISDRGFEIANAESEEADFDTEPTDAASGVSDRGSDHSDVPSEFADLKSEISYVKSPRPQVDRPTGQLGLPAARFGLPSAHLAHHLPPNAWVALVEPTELVEQGRHYLDRLDDARGLFTVEGTLKQLSSLPTVTVAALAEPAGGAVCNLRVESVERFSGDIHQVKAELEGAAGAHEVFLACHNEAEQKRLGEIFADTALHRTGKLHLCTGHVTRGFRLVEPGLFVLSDHQLFQRTEVRRPRRRRYRSRPIESFLDLSEGDYVVHVTHGIARYRGLQLLEKRDGVEEHLVLEFREKTKLYVPTAKIELVQKYVGAGTAVPTLSKIGGTAWLRRKRRVQQAVTDLAAEMIELQGLRAARPGIAFPPDTDWQREFDAEFPYPETVDQSETDADIKADMQRPRPMDRLICGDVGYGKTELAMRAAFKAVHAGKQVAVLVPTTVLAEQHYRTFRDRMAEFPITCDVLSRFRSKKQQRETLEQMKQGAVDIVIGTHRLVQSDVEFRDLGLVIIDEEQRFGVEHKERLKTLRASVDVLTLTATPIPRTLHMALLGIRDISNLETPPQDRLAIQTRICRFDPHLIRQAVLRELNRDGQIFFVHNRVESIGRVAEQLQQIVPEALISVAHGQMPEEQLEQTMLDFINRRSDILVATTIIESGLDIPNVNTIFINWADRYGLADLHQLRGRVGRYKHRAYCYLLLDPKRPITPKAAKRLKAIEEFSDLGAGFRIAMRDLEIRGAGNILGAQQSGHIAAVGYELYCRLLENTVRRLKGQPVREPTEVSIELPWLAYLPRDYVPGAQQKMELYRRLSRIGCMPELDDFRAELEDRFGPLPAAACNLLANNELRLLAQPWQIAAIYLEDRYVVFRYRDARRVRELAAKCPRLRIADDESAYLPMSKQDRSSARPARDGSTAQAHAQAIFDYAKSLLQFES